MKEEQAKLLVQKAMQGDNQAFVALCEAKGSEILYVCIKIMQNQQDGEDAAQEVFIQMQKYILGLQSADAFNVWLNRIIFHACLNLKRKTKRAKGELPLEHYVGLLEENRAEFLPESYLEDKQKQQLIMESINRLSPKYRKVVLLYYFEGLNQQEIAQAMEISENAVSHVLRRARNIIKKEVGAPQQDLLGFTAGLPVISRLLMDEATQLAPNATVQKIIFASGIKNATIGTVSTGGGAAAASHLFARVAGMLFLGAGVLVGGTMLVTTQTKPNTPAASVASIPQYLQPGSNKGLDIEDATESQAPGGNWQPGKAVSSGVSSLPPAGAPAGGRGDATKQKDGFVVSFGGGVVFVNVDGQTVQNKGHYTEGCMVQLVDANQTVLAQTTTNSQGNYIFENLELDAAGEYTLQLILPQGKGLVFAPQMAGGQQQVLLQQNATVTPKPFAITAGAGPTVGLLLYNAQNQRSNINPVRAQVITKGPAQTTYSWEIADRNGQIILQGGEAIGETLAQMQASGYRGLFTLTVAVTDDAGNRAGEWQTIYIR
ncbi:sigma-70 family RNA polymerase sigma factor [Ruminococcaceae bacterium OttesenSCG-928-A16]|nr:sigma-70 family RNA polymerase sigma factor [Ruminococcaceae bacterium OttesenSCG-928-A16]